jgi:perosamine synthetase
MTTIDLSSELAIRGGTPVRTRPFPSSCRPDGRERALLLEAFDSNSWSAFRAGSHGPEVRRLGTMPSAELAALPTDETRQFGGRYVREVEAVLAERIGVPFAVSANSATSALIMAYGALNLGPGDEVLVPAFSFHATATAVLVFGAVPVFVDIKPDTFCLDPADAARKITSRTRAIVPVHLGGNTADLDAVMELARSRGLAVVEDCAQAIIARYRGRPVGSFGDVAVFSLNETKNISAGEGGFVVTADPRIALKARLLRNHGECMVDDGWSDDELANMIGMNFRLTELQAAVAVGQLEGLDDRNAVRNRNAAYLVWRLRRHRCLVPQKLEEGAEPASYILKFRYRPEPGMPSRPELLASMRAEGIPLSGGYARLMHENPLFTRRIAHGSGGFPFNTVPEVRYGRGTLPVAEQLAGEMVWVPFINPPNDTADMDDVVRAFDKVLR